MTVSAYLSQPLVFVNFVTPRDVTAYLTGHAPSSAYLSLYICCWISVKRTLGPWLYIPHLRELCCTDLIHTSTTPVSL